MIAWFFGVMLIGSIFIIGAFTRQGWNNRRPFSRWNAALWLALALDLQALGVTVSISSRLVDIYNGIDLNTSVPWFLFMGYCMNVAAKTLLVWVAALREGQNYSRSLMWGYWLAIVLWTALVAVFLWL